MLTTELPVKAMKDAEGYREKPLRPKRIEYRADSLKLSSLFVFIHINIYIYIYLSSLSDSSTCLIAIWN